MFKIVALER
jgi:hypothetical protein